jgi:hypothetical protein
MLGTAADNTACPLLTRTTVLPPAAAGDTRRSVTMEEETNSKPEEEKEEKIPEDVERKIMENINRGETRRKRQWSIRTVPIRTDFTAYAR